jgi:hypothetical protein
MHGCVISVKALKQEAKEKGTKDDNNHSHQ